MGQEVSSPSCSGSPKVSLERVLSRSGSSATVASRYHSQSSGRRLEDDYEVDHKAILGRGCSCVRKAYSRVTRRHYALKTLDKRGIPLEVLQMRAAEVEISLTLDHPNIVRVHDVYETDLGLVHLVMDCCTGGELFHRLLDRYFFPERDAARAIGQMLRAVGYLHAHGIVHRDLKPENMIYADSSPEAQLKLIDFGFGVMWDPLTLMRMCCGSLRYVSPEVLLQTGYTNKCDMWSLGVIAFMLLMGRQPFEGDTAHVRQKIKTGDVEWSREAQWCRWSSLSGDAVDFVKSLLVTDPEQRLSAQQAIFHPWLIREGVSMNSVPPLQDRVMRSLCGYACTPPLQQAVLRLIVQQASSEEVGGLDQVFLALDLENRGAVHVRDLKAAVRLSLGRPRSRAGCDASGLADGLDVEDVCASIDRFPAERISFSEFLAACLDIETQLKDDTLRAVFHRLDADGSRSPGAAGLRGGLGPAFGPAEVGSWLREVGVLAHPRLGAAGARGAGAPLPRRLAAPCAAGLGGWCPPRARG